MFLHLRYILALVIIASILPLQAQRVTVSKEMSIRNDFAYDIIGKVDENILLYRDKGNEKVVEVFDINMKHLYDREIILEDNRVDIYCIVPQDTAFTIIYGYRQKRLYNMRARKYNSSGTMIDSVTFLKDIDNFRIESFQFEISEDRSKTLLFSSRKNDLFYTYVIDNDEMRVLWRKESKLIGFDVRKDFRGVVLSNLGEVNALFEIDNSKYDRDNHKMILLGLDSSDGLYENVFTFENKLTVDLEMAYDNKNRRIILAGLVSDESEFDATGYFYLSTPVATLEPETKIKDFDFDLNFLGELYGKKLSKKKRLNDFVTRDLVIRNDGGFLLFTEMNKEYYRRSSFNGGARLNSGFNGGGRGWVDIYNEDIIVFSVHPDNTEHWKKILYKKQFSQDDGGIFSSYFLFKTPSRIRLIYNDEIKRNNTVSEYVLDPLGNFERNSLLSTEYQNLKLRFKDALQVSSSILLVPSERNFKLSLVKIEY
ncbi:MAG: hypothetical protein P1U56_12040 [Saprospiraceae bacterium]|nr:hypothetical protein [Saprospiraceae bacterium]